MNKLFTKVAALTLGVAMAAGVGVALGSANASEAKAAEETVSWTATAASDLGSAISEVNGTDVGTITTGSFTWDYTRTLVGLASNKKDNISFQGNTWIQLGSNNAKESLVLTTDDIPGVIKEVNVVAAAAGGLHKITIDVGGTKYVDSGDLVSYSGTAGATNPDPANCKVESSGSSSGAITVTIANPSTTNKAFLIRSLEVVYDEGDTPTTQYSVTDSVENGSVSPSTVSEGATLTATITPDTGYNVPETVSVTMGGVAATHTYQNGVVTVENVTGDVEITGSCVEIPVTPEPDVVETTFADFVAATDADYAKAYHFSATIKAFKSGDTKDKYGNMTLTDGTTDLTVYGSTADATKLVWNGVSAKYEFTNPQDFMTTDLTNDSSVGDTVEVKFVRYYHSSKLNAQGIILSVTPGETPEIPEPEMVTGKKLSDLFADTAGNGKQLYEVTGVVSAWASGKSDATQYGNFYLKESLDSDTEYYIYGATADATKLVWGTASGVYGFSNPKNFLTNEVTKDVVIGSTLTMRLTRCDYNTTLEANGIVVSVVQPTPTDWSNEQKTALETALHGYLPPFFGELAEDMTTTENSAVFTVSGDHSAEFATKLGDGWNLVSDNNYMLVGDNYYLTASIYTYGVRSLPVGDYSEFTFAYHEGQPVQKYTVTYTAGQGTGDNYVVSDVEAGSLHALVTFETAAFTAPEGQQFKGWQVGDDTELRAAGYEVTVSGDVTVIAIYEEIPAQKFTITYKSGYGTGDDIVISDVEAGSSHVLKSFDETQFVAPAGQQFKGWRVGSETELRDPGYEITNIQADINIFANYEDIPVTDWSDAFKTAYTSRFGSTYLPPFVSAEFADENAMYWFDGYPFGYVSVEGNLLSVAISAFNGQWTFVGDAQNAIYIFCDANMNAFVQIVYDTDYGTTDLVFSAIADLALDTTGVKTEYFVGDAVDTTNLTVHPMLFNGTVVPALQLPSSMWTVSPSTFTEAGTQDVTITVSNFFTEPVDLPYSVNVVAVVAESISVSGQATKTSYKAGEEWSAEGLVVTAHYNNGTEADVTDQVTWSFDPAETAVEVTSVSAVAHLGDLSSDAVAFDVVVEQAYDADAFAKDLLDLVAPICANYDGKKNNKVALKTVWDTMSQRYSTLSNEEKAKVIAAAAKTDGTDLEKAMAFYNYACKKYGLTKFIEGRQVKALVTEHETGNSILPIVVIVASSVAAITAIGVVIALKRRKALLAK